MFCTLMEMVLLVVLLVVYMSLLVHSNQKQCNLIFSHLMGQLLFFIKGLLLIMFLFVVCQNSTIQDMVIIEAGDG